VSSRSRLSAHGMIVRRRRALVRLSYGSRRHAAIAHTCRKSLLRYDGAAQAEDAYRVGESRSNYPSVIPGRPNCLILTPWSKWKTPHHALGAGGALLRSLD
jgi:hypothetical protein